MEQQELNLRSMKLSQSRHEIVTDNGPMFKEKAQEFTEQLNLEDFHASDGWLEKLKKRYIDLRLNIYFTK